MDVDAIPEGLPQRRDFRDLRQQGAVRSANSPPTPAWCPAPPRRRGGCAGLPRCGWGCSGDWARRRRGARWWWPPAHRRCARARVRVHVVRQGVRIGGAELGELAPAQNLLGQLFACSASSSSTLALVDHAPVGVLVPPFRPSLPNSRSPICLGEPRLIFPPHRRRFHLPAAPPLREFGGQAGEGCPVDGDAAPFHAVSAR